MLLDNDVLGAAMRMTRSIEVNDETLSFETIKQVCMGGEGHYLGSDQTLRVMQSEYLYPEFSDRDSPLAWEENGKPVLLDKAIARKNKILENYFPSHISDAIDQQIRAEFPIFLSRQAIGR
jgi:trimethylamine--corrinoid protein Co-methyltransferase